MPTCSLASIPILLLDQHHRDILLRQSSPHSTLTHLPSLISQSHCVRFSPPFKSSTQNPSKMVALVSQENVVALVSRTGRQLQRYRKGRRQVVGCIPYRLNCLKESDELELEVLVISSQKGNGMLFPKGGWELDESKKEAALRETIEEAGVRGIVGGKLGKWSFKSKTHDSFYEGYMFPLLVQEQLEFWPEQNVRQRIWMSVAEARQVCRHWWMKDALDRLVNRLKAPTSEF